MRKNVRAARAARTVVHFCVVLYQKKKKKKQECQITSFCFNAILKIVSVSKVFIFCAFKYNGPVPCLCHMLSKSKWKSAIAS